jgi:hypothetical protein
MLPAVAQISIGPAPAGKSAKVAKTVIQDNFGTGVCPSISVAQRLPDGAISAVCSNGERFLVFTVEEIDSAVAMRCSAAAKIGVNC